MAIPKNAQELPLRILRIEEYKATKLVQLANFSSQTPVLMEFERFCAVFSRVSVGYFNPNFYYSSLPLVVSAHIISFEVIADRTTAVYFWLHDDTSLLPYKLCLYFEFEPKKYRFIGEKSFRKGGRLFNATIRGRYMLIL